MALGRPVGRAIGVAIDTLVAGLFIGVLAFLSVPTALSANRIVVAVVAGGLAPGVTLPVALALAGRGRRPFPATRLARAGLARLPSWAP